MPATRPIPDLVHGENLEMQDVVAIMSNEITGSNAGGPRWLSIRRRWPARIAQFHR
jgi:hypothetical protein